MLKTCSERFVSQSYAGPRAKLAMLVVIICVCKKKDNVFVILRQNTRVYFVFVCVVSVDEDLNGWE